MKPRRSKRRRIDWEAIEREYRADTMSLRQLAAKHSVDPSDLSKKIKRDQQERPGSWQKDLREAVEVATALALINPTPNPTDTPHDGPEPHTRTDARETITVVLATAELNKEVILRHRADLLEARNVVAGMLGELRATCVDVERLERLFLAATQDLDGLMLKAARQQFGELLRLHGRVGSALKLSEAMSRLQQAERLAFGIDNGGSGGKGRPGIPLEPRYDMDDDELLVIASRARRSDGGD